MIRSYTISLMMDAGNELLTRIYVSGLDLRLRRIMRRRELGIGMKCGFLGISERSELRGRRGCRDEL